MKTIFKMLAAMAAAAALLGGCAVYQPAPLYSQGPYSYYQPAPVYSQPGPGYYGPAPVYVQPGPVYLEPPVSFGFNFSYRNGGRRGWGGPRRHW
jgi:hypothetical protein